MANIIKMLEKEVEKGNILINRHGDLVSLQKVRELLKKDYLKGLKAGTINFDVSFDVYETTTIDSDFLDLPHFITKLELAINGDYVIVPHETEEMGSDPAEPVQEEHFGW